MESIEQLLESLPTHFGRVAPTPAAAKAAESMAVRLSDLAFESGRGGMSGTDAAGLDRRLLLMLNFPLAMRLPCDMPSLEVL